MVFAVGTENEAEKLLEATCLRNHQGEWIATELAESQTLENLEVFSTAIDKAHDVLLQEGECECEENTEEPPPIPDEEDEEDEDLHEPGEGYEPDPCFECDGHGTWEEDGRHGDCGHCGGSGECCGRCGDPEMHCRCLPREDE